MMSITKKLSEEITPLVAYGLILIGCILSYLGLMRLSDTVQFLKSEIIATKTELVTLSQLPEGNVWEQRLQQSETAKQQIQNRIWKGSTLGIISADLEQALNKIALDVNITQPRIGVEHEIIDLAGLEVMYFTVNARLESNVTAIDFIARLSQEPRKIVILGSNISLPERQTASISVNGYVPIEIVSEGNP